MPKLDHLIIERLVMANPPEQLIMTPVDLVHLKELTNLTGLQLPMELTTDGSLAHIESLKNLEDLILNYAEITDAGLVRLKGLTRLKDLYQTQGSILVRDASHG